MRFYYNIFSFLISLLCSLSLYAAPSGNPAFPELLREGYFIPAASWVDLRLGFEGDFVNNARMQQRVEGHGRIDTYAQISNSGTATLNFLDKLDIYGVFGNSRTNANWRFLTAFQTTNRIEMETNYSFLGAIGARALFYQWGDTTLGVGGRYSQTSPPLSSMTLNGTPTPTTNARLHWREWQINLSLSHAIEIFIPYIGIKYSHTTSWVGSLPIAISESGAGKLHMQNGHPVGLIIGCSLTTSRFFILNIEGRLIDEEAATISADIRF